MYLQTFTYAKEVKTLSFDGIIFLLLLWKVLFQWKPQIFKLPLMQTTHLKTFVKK